MGIFPHHRSLSKFLFVFTFDFLTFSIAIIAFRPFCTELQIDSIKSSEETMSANAYNLARRLSVKNEADLLRK